MAPAGLAQAEASLALAPAEDARASTFRMLVDGVAACRELEDGIVRARPLQEAHTVRRQAALRELDALTAAKRAAEERDFACFQKLVSCAPLPGPSAYARPHASLA